MAFDWKEMVKSVAPVIGTVVSGGNPLVGTGIKILSEAILGRPDGTEAEVQDAIQRGLTPDQIVAMKKADQDFKLKMKEAGIEVERIHAKDRDSARRREIETGDTVVGALALLITAGFFGVLGWILMEGVPAKGGDALLIMLGSLGTAWTGIVTYYFGSSRGSSKKNATLEKAMAGMTGAPRGNKMAQ